MFSFLILYNISTEENIDNIILSRYLKTTLIDLIEVLTSDKLRNKIIKEYPKLLYNVCRFQYIYYGLEFLLRNWN